MDDIDFTLRGICPDVNNSVTGEIDGCIRP